MAVNNVKLANGETLLDLTSDTITPEVVLQGYTGHTADGEPFVGRMPVNNGIDLYTTVVVEELNSATNPTGVQVQTGTYYYYKIVDDLYDSSFFVGKSLQKYATNTVIKIQSDGIMYVGNNGSYTISTTQNVVSGGGPDIIVCIQPQDVGIALTTNRGTLTFPESGTYIITGGTTTSYKVKGVGGSFKKTEATISDDMPVWQGGMF